MQTDQEIILRNDGRVAVVHWSNDCSFTEQERPLIHALLSAWPRACSYEQLLSVLPDGETGESTQERLARLRFLISYCRPRLALLNLQVVSIMDGGLRFLPFPPPSPRAADGANTP